MKKLCLVKWPDETATLWFGNPKHMFMNLDAIDDPGCAVYKELDSLALNMVLKSVKFPGGEEGEKNNYINDVEEEEGLVIKSLHDIFFDKEEWKPVRR